MNTFKSMVKIGLAYLGVIIGAGFASGQEMFQYFVSFGKMGIWGLVISSILFIVGGIVLLQFGSYYKVQEHSEVFNHISSPFISKVIDFLINMTLFCTGFIMIAGAGTNLNQQFNWPIWAGALLVSALVIVTGFMDVDKVTGLIGMVTPFVIVFLLGIFIHTLNTMPIPYEEAMATAAAQATTLPNWLISTLNYTSLALMLAISMAVVIGGEEYSPKQAGLGGLFGGVLVGGLLFASFFSISLNIDGVLGSSMPLLTLFDNLDPRLGVAMAIIIFGMIYNTAIGMYYALAKRVSRSKPENFTRNMIILVGIGFVLSFAGFDTLVAYLYPFIGYCGFFVIALLIIQWAIRYRHIHREIQVRDELIKMEVDRQDEDYEFGREEAADMRALYDESRVDNKELYDEVTELGQTMTDDAEDN
ncbi:YkvI family membrane protein [Aerococcus sanguinicola]|uniref:YkvI family membrane protein n=2 Tax=unclassified Aerococcus TaxID=2618060 RepID=UPI0008C586B2|nr:MULTISPECIES: hypothetical protein [unclassified Aerococcus]KAB0645535.1 hypothetical protein F6I01_10775 [Aerococcus sanguinicola]MDK6856683.1 hypothetical protein [Aerococcus sp. UMB7533]OHO42740.1 hypothetical protein HMPREF2705_02750 [Aerococcus sp. HMSC035B07]MDK6233644.1 hypothetical protein [Aerococcus sp. UMB10185]MDK8503158.1 hypothetical protein [Aerococcus sp. UMB1112A]